MAAHKTAVMSLSNQMMKNLVEGKKRMDEKEERKWLLPKCIPSSLLLMMLVL